MAVCAGSHFPSKNLCLAKDFSSLSDSVRKTSTYLGYNYPRKVRPQAWHRHRMQHESLESTVNIEKLRVIELKRADERKAERRLTKLIN